MRSQNNQNSQLEKARSCLMQLRLNVTTADRKEAEMELKVSAVTLWRYLKGQGSDLDTATRLIQFFRERIASRDKIIAA